MSVPIKPNPPRIIMSKRMTLVIGAMCSDGMYFCCDTEEGTLTGNKRHAKKLFHASHGAKWHLVIGTAGFAPLCDVAVKSISDSAIAAGDHFFRKHEELIEDEMERIYTKYIPNSLPDWKRIDRQISLVIGVFDRTAMESRLYRTYEEILQPMNDSFACAGVGEGIAHYYLDRLYQDFRPPHFTGRIPKLHEAERLLAYVMREAKTSVGSVGGNTDTISIRANEAMVHFGTLGAGWDAKQPELSSLINHFWLDEPTPKRSISRKSKDRQ